MKSWLRSGAACSVQFVVSMSLKHKPRGLPGDAHHHGDDDGDLHGADDGGDEDVVELLSARDHVEDVEVLRLVALMAFVARVAPGAGHTLAC